MFWSKRNTVDISVPVDECKPGLGRRTLLCLLSSIATLTLTIAALSVYVYYRVCGLIIVVSVG
jgi:hypothetical protein